MAYYALYRQWRPKDFSHVVGQRAVIETLRNQVISDRIAHAYLFCGSRGTGKTSTAKILARAINCEHPENGDPCGKCPNCLRMENEESLDIIEIDAASNNGVDEIRELRDSVKYPPQYGKYRVYIIDEVHMLSTSAFNALLKTLEEPPVHIVFILATTEPQKLPETILSRCQRFDFGRISVSDIQNRLREAAESAGATVSNGALMIIARAAEGGMRDALSILDMCLGYGSEIDENMVRNILGTSDQSFLFEFVQYLGCEDSANLFRMIDKVMRDGRDPSVFLRDVTYHLRSLLLAKCCPKEFAEILDLTEEDAAEFVKQSEAFTVSRLMNVLDLYMRAEGEMRYVSSPRLALENVSLKACIRTVDTDTQALNDRIAELEKKIDRISAQAPAFVATLPSTEKKEIPSSTVRHVSDENASLSKTVQNSGFTSVWTEAMNRMKKSEPALWSMLSQGKTTCTAQIISWHPLKQEGSEFFIGTLNREEKKSRILDCLHEITGMQYSFSAVPYSASDPKASDTSDQAYLDTLYRTFGEEPVDVVENL